MGEVEHLNQKLILLLSMAPLFMIKKLKIIIFIKLSASFINEVIIINSSI